MNAGQIVLIYSSPNGDNWFLCHDGGASSHAFVRHKANPSSGGHETDFEIDDFLNRGPHNPEHRALLRLIEDGALSSPKPARPARVSKARNAKARKRSAD